MPRRERETTASTSHSQLLNRRDFVARTLAIAQLAYEGEEGPELAYRIERLGK